MDEYANKVVIFIGPPGSGKDTQANLLVEEFGMVQMPSSKLLREKFATNPDDPEVVHEQELFDTGKLNSPVFVANVMLDFVRACAKQGKGIIFSGSPRTVGEVKAEIPVLSELYGVQHVTVLFLNLEREESKRRIAGRRFCRANSHPVPGSSEFSHLKVCPLDGSELYARPLDNPALLDTRFKEYHMLTEPCLAVLKEAGFTIHELDGSKTIQGIHQEIIGILERQRNPVPKE